MGLFSPYVYKNKKGEKYWLHAVQKGKVMFYYFSKDATDALWNFPKGFEVIENKAGFPMLKKKKVSFLPMPKIFEKKEKKTEEEPSA